MYDVAVVGLGLIGSAAFRHLIDMGVRTVGIGPSEPANLRDRERVFASHYDEGRITRIVDPLPFWAAAGRRSMIAAITAGSAIVSTGSNVTWSWFFACGAAVIWHVTAKYGFL